MRFFIDKEESFIDIQKEKNENSKKLKKILDNARKMLKGSKKEGAN